MGNGQGGKSFKRKGRGEHKKYLLFFTEKMFDRNF